METPMTDRQSSNEERAEKLAEALRQVVALVEATPDLVDAFEAGFQSVQAYVGFTFADKPATLATFARAALRHGATVTKDATDEWSSVDAQWGPVKVSAYAHREEVCERVQVGEETVTETVPDPDVVVPTIEVTKIVPVYEWVCAPLLAAAEGGA